MLSFLGGSWRLRPLTFSRGFAKNPSKFKQGVADEPVSVAVSENSEDIVRGLNIFKDSEAVRVKPDTDYPDWLYTLHMPRASLEQLTTTYISASLSASDTKRMIKLWNKKRIREHDEANKK